VVKLLEGTQGIGVVLAETPKSAQSMIEAFRGVNANILVQEFIKEAGGSDIRCFVIGDKVIASMQRQREPGEFRSNIDRGGSGSRIWITPQERAAAIGAAQAMGLRVCGVNMLRSNHGPVNMEVKSSPGLEGIETPRRSTLPTRSSSIWRRMRNRTARKRAGVDSVSPR